MKTNSKYIIKKGDTFWGLEKQHGLTHGTLQKLNPHINPKTLQIGSKIVISEEDAEEKDVEKQKPKIDVFSQDNLETNENNMLPFNVVQSAKNVIETYRKNEVQYSQAKRQFGIDAKFSDCSATVHTILKLSNALHVLSSTNTSAMRREIANKGGQFRKTNPKVSDIMMWGGHVTIVTEVKNDTVFFAHMGNSGARIGAVRLDNNKLSRENVWGSGGFIGFWSIN